MASIQARNVNHPEYRESLKAEKYHIIRSAMLAVLPDEQWMSFKDMEDKVRDHLTEKAVPTALFPKPGVRSAGIARRYSLIWKRAAKSSASPKNRLCACGSAAAPEANRRPPHSPPIRSRCPIPAAIHRDRARQSSHRG